MKADQVFKSLILIVVSCHAVAHKKEENSFASKTKLVSESIQDSKSIVANVYLDTPGESALRKWPRGVVRYKLGPNFDVDHVIFILRAMKDIESVSCVRFHPVSYSTKAFIKIRNSSKNCSTKVGYSGSEQNFNLRNDPLNSDCFRTRSILQLLLQALGFNYQHKAANRDRYIRIRWKNIEKDKEHFFAKLDSKMMPDFGVEYDYESIMHVDSKMFSKNGNDTIVPLKGSNIQLGEQISLSDGDIRKLRKMYKCKEQ